MTMWRWMILGICTVALVSGPVPSVMSAEPVTLENAEPPSPNTEDEPLAKEFSLQKAVNFLDAASLTWLEQRQCFTCHTNYAYLYARPQIDAQATAHQTVRKAAEELVDKRWPEKKPRWDAEVVATAAALAFNDAASTGRLASQTRVALDRMWTVQRKDGGWTWLKCGWPPMESDDDYGASLAALAVSVAPENYRYTPAAQAGIVKLKAFIHKNPPPTLHHSAMLLWASSTGEPFLTPEQTQSTVTQLLALQQSDGGWTLPSLGNWKRANGDEQSQESDGYGTGFAIYVLRQAQIPANDARLQRGISWLKANQRESGRWFTHSLKKDGHHFISHAGTAFAVMAIQSCNISECPQWQWQRGRRARSRRRCSCECVQCATVSRCGLRR